jgi:hypothetical protein
VHGKDYVKPNLIKCDLFQKIPEMQMEIPVEPKYCLPASVIKTVTLKK